MGLPRQWHNARINCFVCHHSAALLDGNRLAPVWMSSSRQVPSKAERNMHMKFCRIALPCAVALFLALCLYAADKPLSVGMIPDAGGTQGLVYGKERLQTHLCKNNSHT